MKKKISGFFLGIFMFVFSLFSLSACSLVSVDKTKLNSQSVLTVGDKVLTRGDIINSFYTYYQNNGAYFSYYDNQTIEDSFYLWTIMRQIVRDRADELFASGELYYTEEDDKEVWDSVKDYFYNNVNDYEKAIYKFNNYLEENYPIWLRDDEEEDSDTLFEPYSKPELDFRPSSTGENFKKLSDDEIKNSKVKEVKDYIFEYSLGEDEEGNDRREKINYAGNLREGSRNDAFTNYIMSLVASAKASGANTDENVVFENEVIRVYNSYYENKLTSILQQYYTSNYIMNLDLSKPLSDERVVEKFLDAYNSDLQKYQGENNYITKITDSSGASLVLYNYNGQNFFFTVQHILISYDDYMTERIKELYGYDFSTGSSRKDFPIEVYLQYKELRDGLTEGYNMLSKINEDNLKKMTSLISEETDIDYFNYYYIDSSIEDDKGSKYIQLTKKNEEGVTKFVDNDENEYDEGDVVKMSSEEQILALYKKKFEDFTKTDGLFDTYFKNSIEWVKDKENTESQYYINRETTRKGHEDFEYIFDTLDSIVELSGEEGYTLAKQKIASFLFVELEWLFSGDTLKNELSNKMGYVMSNYFDQNGSWVVEFAEGARDIIGKLMDGAGTDKESLKKAIQNVFSQDSVDFGKLTTTIISNYGYHIIKIEDIFVQGTSVIEFEPQTKDTNGKYSEEYIAELTKKLKQTYVCSASNQTLYDYYYNELFNELIGTNGSGNYFVNQQYSWYNKYISDNKVTYIDKLTYRELLDEIS